MRSLRAKTTAGAWCCRRSAVLIDGHAVSDGRVKGLGIDDGEAFELDAVARDAGCADRGAVGARQVGLVVEAEHIDRDARRVRAEADAVELARRPVGMA